MDLESHPKQQFNSEMYPSTTSLNTNNTTTFSLTKLFSCRKTAETFARKLHLKLTTLGGTEVIESEEEELEKEKEKEEKEKVLFVLENNISMEQTIDNQLKNNNNSTNNTDSDIYYDFDISSPIENQIENQIENNLLINPCDDLYYNVDYNEKIDEKCCLLDDIESGCILSSCESVSPEQPYEKLISNENDNLIVKSINQLKLDEEGVVGGGGVGGGGEEESINIIGLLPVVQLLTVDLNLQQDLKENVENPSKCLQSIDINTSKCLQSIDINTSKCLQSTDENSLQISKQMDENSLQISKQMDEKQLQISKQMDEKQLQIVKQMDEKQIDENLIKSYQIIDKQQPIIELNGIKSELKKSKISNIYIDSSSDSEEDNNNKLKIKRSSSLKTKLTPPGTPGRKKIVRFADALGLDLADVRTFLDEIPNVPKSAFRDLECALEAQNAFSISSRINNFTKTLVPTFHQPVSRPDFFDRIREQKVLLENAFLADNFTIKGTVRVKNMDFHKSLYIRYTLDEWRTFVDFQATYVQGSCDGFSDKFEFSLQLTPNCIEIGGKVTLATRFHCSGQQFWDNNNGQNYIFHCVPTSCQNQQSCINFYSNLDDPWINHMWM